jgi:hypothetical protein
MFGYDILLYGFVDKQLSTQEKVGYFRLFILFSLLQKNEEKINTEYEKILRNIKNNDNINTQELMVNNNNNNNTQVLYYSRFGKRVNY